MLLKQNIWEELSRKEQWEKLSDNDKQTTHRSAVEETWGAINQARTTSGVKQRKGIKIRWDWTIGHDPMKKHTFGPEEDPDASGGSTMPWQNLQIHMMSSNPGGDGNKDNNNNENNKKKVYKDRDDIIWERLREAPQLVTDEDKRRYRQMMNTIMARGRWGSPRYQHDTLRNRSSWIVDFVGKPGHQ